MSDRKVWEFRVLGPLEVWRGGPAILLGAPKQRVLLAALILRANRVVTADTLLELLWDDHPPATARNTLHTLVRRLRRVLAADEIENRGTAEERLVTRPSGYSLRIEDPDSSDLATFEELAAEGRRMSSRAPARAASLLRRGLSLWRGGPLADIDSEWLRRVEIPRLEEQRLTAIEDRVMADLMCRRHGELIGELQALVASHPMRPRLLGQLMLALHRSGRQAEALTTYRSARHAMIEEFGLEPTFELQQLQQAILEGDDASLDLGEQPAAGDALALLPARSRGPGPPHQLPPDAAVFVGRDKELAWLMRMMLARQSAGQPATTIVRGQAGVGKSTLAIHAAHLLADHFSDGHLFADLHGVRRGEDVASPLRMLRQFLRALDVADAQVPESLDEAGARFRSVTASKRILVVLDNAGSAEQVQQLLPAGPGCGALVTSRQALIGRENAPQVHVGMLSADDAVELLRQFAGRQRIDDEPEAARMLADLCEHLPLALRIAAERLALRPAWPVCALAERLTEPRRRLDELALGSVAVRSSLQASYGALPTDDARMFQMLGLLNGTEMSVDQLASLLQQDSDQVEAGLERLVDFGLLRSTAPGQYSVNELTWLFARETAREAAPVTTSGRVDGAQDIHACRATRGPLRGEHRDDGC